MTVDTYDSTAKGLHWLIVVLVAVQFVLALLMPDIGPHTAPNELVDLHLSFGVVILVVMAVRWVHRLLHPVRLDASSSPAWELAVATWSHRAFYLLVLVGPFLGWASASAHSIPVRVFGLFRLPDIAAPKARWALQAGDLHIYLMWTLLALIALHIAGALYHRLVRRDGVLARMLPAGR